MSVYWPEFLKIVLAHMVAVASPGPDFAIVLRQAVTYGRRSALWTALGVSTPICFHVAYSLYGVGLLLRNSPAIYLAIRIAGAVYLGWIGFKCLSASRRYEVSTSTDVLPIEPSARASWSTGLLTTALNPKVPLFFIAFFATLISPGTPSIVRAGYGVWISLATMAWFSFVAYVFAWKRVRAAFSRSGPWVDRSMGLIFIILATTLVLSGFQKGIVLHKTPSITAQIR